VIVGWKVADAATPVSRALAARCFLAPARAEDHARRASARCGVCTSTDPTPSAREIEADALETVRVENVDL
jgi:hypothetical protein